MVCHPCGHYWHCYTGALSMLNMCNIFEHRSGVNFAYGALWMPCTNLTTWRNTRMVARKMSVGWPALLYNSNDWDDNKKTKANSGARRHDFALIYRNDCSKWWKCRNSHGWVGYCSPVVAVILWPRNWFKWYIFKLIPQVCFSGGTRL